MVTINIRQNEHLQAEKLFLPDFAYDNNKGFADLVIKNRDLQSEYALWTTVTILLFSDLRREESEGITSDDPHGWVGDMIDDDKPIGSYLWLLQRTYIDSDTRERFRIFANSALDILVEQELIKSYNVIVSDNGKNKIILDITLFARYSQEKYNQKFELVWGQIYAL